MAAFRWISMTLIVLLARMAPAAECEAMRSKDFRSVLDAPTQVTAALEVAASGTHGSYCLVSGYVSPNIGIKIGLPSRWNGRFLHAGCAGHCGTTEYFDWSCSEPLRRGYACIVSDMGHQGTLADGVWAYENLQAKVDWGFRATHVVTLAGKAITESFYKTPPGKSYFVGESTGGRQALQEAQKFPWDVDGIVAISPPVDLSMIYLTFAWGARVLHDKDGSPLVGRAELQLLTDAAVKSCDLDDGVADEVIGDPLDCDFDPVSLACGAAARSGQCLSPLQLAAVKKIYAGPTTSAGEKLSPGGPLFGSEIGQWDADPTIGWATSYLSTSPTNPGYKDLAVEGFRYLFFWPDAGPSWQLTDLDFDRDSRRLALRQSLYDSSNPDLRRFKAAGGKLIVLQGLNDNSVLPRSTIDYYETVTRTMGGSAQTQSFFRMFLFPGTGHGLYGGKGAGVVDYLTAIEAWVEHGKAPDQLTAMRLERDDRQHPISFPVKPEQVQFTRPIYPYPARAKYRGHGSPNQASSFYPINLDERQISSTTSGMQ